MIIEILQALAQKATKSMTLHHTFMRAASRLIVWRSSFSFEVSDMEFLLAIGNRDLYRALFETMAELLFLLCNIVPNAMHPPKDADEAACLFEFENRTKRATGKMKMAAPMLDVSLAQYGIRTGPAVHYQYAVLFNRPPWNVPGLEVLENSVKERVQHCCNCVYQMAGAIQCARERGGGPRLLVGVGAFDCQFSRVDRMRYLGGLR